MAKSPWRLVTVQENLLESCDGSTSLMCRVPSPLTNRRIVGLTGLESTIHCTSSRGYPATGHGNMASCLLIAVRFIGDRADGRPNDEIDGLLVR